MTKTDKTTATTKKTKHGGARNGAGRKAIPKSERKKQINFYVKEKNVDFIRAKIHSIIEKYDV